MAVVSQANEVPVPPVQQLGQKPSPDHSTPSPPALGLGAGRFHLPPAHTGVLEDPLFLSSFEVLL